jgi:hypothetical protein
MDSELVVHHLDRAVAHRTGQRLNHLQCLILRQVYQGQKYREIADDAGYTEGHIKDVGSDLWQLLSHAFGTKFTKSNCKAMVKRSLQSAGLYKPEHFIPPVGDVYRSSPTPDVAPLSLANWDWAALELPVSDGIAVSNGSLPQRLSPAASLLWGRSIAVAQINQLVQQGRRVIVLQGMAGSGKTALAQHFLHDSGAAFDCVLELLIPQDASQIMSAPQVVAEWLQQDFAIDPGTDFGVALSRLQRQLQQRSVGILLDRLEGLLDQRGSFLAEHRQYAELLRVLAQPRSLSTTLITSRDRLGEGALDLGYCRLPGLSATTWIEWFQHSGCVVEGGAVDGPNAAMIERLCGFYGGNAKAMQLIAQAVQTDCDRDLATYWQWHQTLQHREADFMQLVLGEMARLKQLDPLAAQLLDRLGAYAPLERSRLSLTEITAMLWDVPEAKHLSLIQSLQQRSFLVFQQGEYQLAPIVQQLAWQRLQDLPEREVAIGHRDRTSRSDNWVSLSSSTQAGCLSPTDRTNVVDQPYQ